MTIADIAISVFFFCVMLFAGVVLFFGSDYAQKRWGAEAAPTKSEDSPLVIVSDYRVRK